MLAFAMTAQSAFRLATSRSQLSELCWPRVPPKVTHSVRDLPRTRAGLFHSCGLAARAVS
jgi:hypothetical protein